MKVTSDATCFSMPRMHVLQYKDMFKFRIWRYRQLGRIYQFEPQLLLRLSLDSCQISSSASSLVVHSLFRFRILTSEVFESIWTFDRTPWTGDQPDARPPPTQDNTTQKNADTHIHTSSGIRTHDPSVRAVEDNTCFRPRGHWGHSLKTFGWVEVYLHAFLTPALETSDQFYTQTALPPLERAPLPIE
jgi:hypothetical protein